MEKDTPPHLLLHEQVGLGAWLASRSGSRAAWLESWSLARRSGSGSAWLAVISLFLRDLLGPYLALIAPHLLPASEITHDNARASGTDMEFVKKFTPSDFQVKNFTPSISPNFNSFSKKKHKNE